MIVQSWQNREMTLEQNKQTPVLRFKSTILSLHPAGWSEIR